VAVLIGLLSPAAAPAGEATPVAGGRRVYDREGCAMCHSIAGQGSRRVPLDGVGGRLGREEIRKWIVAPQEMKPGVKKEPYRLDAQDLDLLVEYLSTLKQ
jgi:mono/diheme cytochrome c family protein